MKQDAYVTFNTFYLSLCIAFTAISIPLPSPAINYCACGSRVYIAEDGRFSCISGINKTNKSARLILYHQRYLLWHELYSGRFRMGDIV